MILRQTISVRKIVCHIVYLKVIGRRFSTDTSGNTVEIPNPLILPKMFSPENDPQVYVDSESTIPISNSSRYDLSRFLRHNLTRNTYADGPDAYRQYKEQLETMFTAQVSISPGENIRANTAQLPTLCYHGNMKVKYGGVVTKCSRSSKLSWGEFIVHLVAQVVLSAVSTHVRLVVQTLLIGVRVMHFRESSLLTLEVG